MTKKALASSFRHSAFDILWSLVIGHWSFEKSGPFEIKRVRHGPAGDGCQAVGGSQGRLHRPARLHDPQAGGDSGPRVWRGMALDRHTADVDARDRPRRLAAGQGWSPDPKASKGAPARADPADCDS